MKVGPHSFSFHTTKSGHQNLAVSSWPIFRQNFHCKSTEIYQRKRHWNHPIPLILFVATISQSIINIDNLLHELYFIMLFQALILQIARVETWRDDCKPRFHFILFFKKNVLLIYRTANPTNFIKSSTHFFFFFSQTLDQSRFIFKYRNWLFLIFLQVPVLPVHRRVANTDILSKGVSCNLASSREVLSAVSFDLLIHWDLMLFWIKTKEKKSWGELCFSANDKPVFPPTPAAVSGIQLHLLLSG